MQTNNLSDLEVSFIPATVKRRHAIIVSIVQELKRRNFKSLDDKNSEDLKKVMQIVSDLHPETSFRLVREYAKVSIRSWKRENE